MALAEGVPGGMEVGVSGIEVSETTTEVWVMTGTTAWVVGWGESPFPSKEASAKRTAPVTTIAAIPIPAIRPRFLLGAAPGSEATVLSRTASTVAPVSAGRPSKAVSSDIAGMVASMSSR
jgi:hypothetical protein